MASLDYHLSRFETLIQDLVEGSLRRMLGQRRLSTEIATKLAQALERQALQGQAATHYRVVLSTADYESIGHEQTLLREQLAAFVTAMATEMQIPSPGDVTVWFSHDKTYRSGQVSVATERNGEEGGITRVERKPSGSDALVALRNLDAFLIADGKRHISLDRPVMSIGRQIDNDIVIESSSVSRHHAQVRWRFGRFVLIDLGSRAGTMLNGEAVQAAVLQPGDVISISDVALIYGVGNTSQDTPSAAGDASDHSTQNLVSQQGE
jgi:hypothetical protein